MFPYFKIIKLSNLEKLQQSLTEMIPTHLYNKLGIWLDDNQEAFLNNNYLISALTEVGIDINEVSVRWYIMNPYYIGAIHTDTGIHDYSFNIPVINCDNTFTKFYSYDPEKPPKLIGRKSPGTNLRAFYEDYSKSNCKIETEFQSNVPAVITTRIPHNVINPNDSYRVNLLIREDKNVQLKKLFTTA